MGYFWMYKGCGKRIVFAQLKCCFFFRHQLFLRICMPVSPLICENMEVLLYLWCKHLFVGKEQ